MAGKQDSMSKQTLNQARLALIRYENDRARERAARRENGSIMLALTCETIEARILTQGAV